MILTDEQVIQIEKHISKRGVEIKDLFESMVDHICCQIENSKHYDFNRALEEAMEDFDAEEMNEVQNEIQIQMAFKKFKKSKKWQFTLGFIATFFMSTGILFKQMHWPSANICLLFGVFILNFGFLPMYFFDRYKNSIKTSK